MSAPRVIPDKRCAECGARFRPHSWKQFRNQESCCCRRHASVRAYRHQQKDRLIAGTRQRTARLHRARVQQQVGRQYGPLSVREIALFNLGVKVGYDRGYAKAYNRTERRKDKRSEAAA